MADPLAWCIKVRKIKPHKKRLTRTTGHDLQTRQEVTLKLEYVWINHSYLENEIKIYKELAGGPGIP